MEALPQTPAGTLSLHPAKNPFEKWFLDLLKLLLSPTNTRRAICFWGNGRSKAPAPTSEWISEGAERYEELWRLPHGSCVPLAGAPHPCFIFCGFLSKIPSSFQNRLHNSKFCAIIKLPISGYGNFRKRLCTDEKNSNPSAARNRALRIRRL